MNKAMAPNYKEFSNYWGKVDGQRNEIRALELKLQDSDKQVRELTEKLKKLQCEYSQYKLKTMAVFPMSSA